MDIDAWLNAALSVSSRPGPPGESSSQPESQAESGPECQPSASSQPASSRKRKPDDDKDKPESDHVTRVLKSVAARTATRGPGKWMNTSVAAVLHRNFFTHPPGCGWRYHQWSDTITSPLEGVFRSRGIWLRRLRVASICSGATPDAMAPEVE